MTEITCTTAIIGYAPNVTGHWHWTLRHDGNPDIPHHWNLQISPPIPGSHSWNCQCDRPIERNVGLPDNIGGSYRPLARIRPPIPTSHTNWKEQLTL